MHGDLASFDVSGFKERKSLNVIPVKVRESDDDGLFAKDIVLHDVPAEMPYSRPGVDNPDIRCVVRGDEDATGTPAIRVELWTTDRNRAPTSVVVSSISGAACLREYFLAGVATTQEAATR